MVIVILSVDGVLQDVPMTMMPTWQEVLGLKSQYMSYGAQNIALVNIIELKDRMAQEPIDPRTLVQEQEHIVQEVVADESVKATVVQENQRRGPKPIALSSLRQSKS